MKITMACRPVILFVAPRNNLYGASLAFVELIAGVSQRGYQPLVALQSPGPLSERLDRQSIPWIPLKTHRWIGTPRGPYRRLRNRLQDEISARKIARVALHRGAALVHTNTLSSPIGGLIAKKSGLPHLWHLRESYDTDPGSAFSQGLAKSARFFDGHTDLAVCVSNYVAGQTARFCPLSKIKRVYDGHLNPEDERRPPKDRKPIDLQGPIHLLLVGKICKRKGHLSAILGLDHLRQGGLDVRLRIVGDGSERYVAELKKHASELGVAPAIEWAGYAAPRPFYESSDLSLICGPQDPLPRVAIESLAHGIPTVAIRSGGLPEIIDDEETGWLFEEGSSERLANRVRDALFESPLRRLEMSCEGRRRVFQRFNLPRHCDEIARLYADFGLPNG